MSINDGKVLLCRLYERTSARGNRYLAGRLGAARLIGFLDDKAELQFGATACFTIYVQDAGDDARLPEAQASAGSDYRPPAAVQKPKAKEEKPAAVGEPYDDLLDDIGRSR
jgi:hypothetical protein